MREVADLGDQVTAIRPTPRIACTASTTGAIDHSAGAPRSASRGARAEPRHPRPRGCSPAARSAGRGGRSGSWSASVDGPGSSRARRDRSGRGAKESPADAGGPCRAPAGRGPRSHQVAHRLVGGIGHPDRGQLAGAMRPASVVVAASRRLVFTQSPGRLGSATARPRCSPCQPLAADGRRSRTARLHTEAQPPVSAWPALRQAMQRLRGAAPRPGSAPRRADPPRRLPPTWPSSSRPVPRTS